MTEYIVLLHCLAQRMEANGCPETAKWARLEIERVRGL